MRRKRLFSLLAILTLLISLTIAVPIAQGDGDGPQGFSVPEKQEQPYPNLSSHLNQLVASVEQGQLSAKQAAADSPFHSGGSVAVTIHLSGNVDDVVDFLEDNGGDPRNVGEDYIEAYVPVTLLGRLSQQPGVTRVWEIVPPEPAYGNVTSQAVGLHQAGSWQDAGYRGQGVKVGIIDVGFTGYSSLMGVELPNNVVARCYTDVGVFTSNLADCEAADEEPSASTPDQCYDYVAENLAGGEPHGTAVAEAVIDIAPDATLYISNPGSWADLQSTADWMAGQGVEIINYSVGWTHYGSRGDGTSPFSDSPLNTVDRAVANGITWVNAAGNSAGDTWLGSYSDNDGDGLISFNNSTAEINPIVLRECRRYTFQLRWADSWDNAATDLDIFLWDTSTDSILEIPREWGFIGSRFSANAGIPFEFFSLRSPINSTDVGIVIVHRSGPEPEWIQLELFSGPGGLGYSNDGSITNPAESANPGLLAVGAAPFYDTNTIEPFSSRGPTPDGRIKPDIVGVDCAASVSYELFTRRNSGQDCWFPGTSQASPHVAGLAALVKQRFPKFTPDQVADYLEYYAQQREAPDPNNTWGHGFAVLPEPDNSEPAPGFDTSCRETLGGDGTVTDQWATGCNSQTPAPGPGSGARLARYYTFSLDQESEVTIALTRNSGNADTYLYLREGNARSGTALHENDDDGSDTTRSKIRETLPDGTYTIEATTYSPGQTGSFILTVSSSGGTPAPGPVNCEAYPITADNPAITGQWDDGCLSQDREDRYASYYTFELNEESEVTITLEADEADAYLYLRQGYAQSGTALNDHAADDDAGGGQNSQVKETLPAGVYTIEATTYKAGETGAFTLSAAGISATPLPDEECLESLAEVGARAEGEVVVNGQWESDSECESKVRFDSYARYYTFTPEQVSEFTITLSSENANPYLYLREGKTRIGAALHENDDHEGSASVSQIQVTLPTGGTYTIEATTKNPKEASGFTLRISWPSATVPIDDDCVQTINANGTVSGQWAPGCESETPAPGPGSGARLARYYTFSLDQESEVTIALTRNSGNADTYLYLREGDARSGAALHENDDDGSDTTRSKIRETLPDGTYTIEATTYRPGQTGSFTIAVSSSGGTAALPPSSDCVETITADGAVSRQWVPGCESETPAPGSGSGARLARYYTFTLGQYSEATIVLSRDSGNADTYLYLRKGHAGSGEALHYNDDDGSDTTKSIIREILSPGTYTIEATTYRPGQTGAFTLTLTAVAKFGDGRVPVAVVLVPLGENLLWVAHYDNPTATWSVYDPSDTFSPSELPFPGGTYSGPIGDLTHMVDGEIYWIKVNQGQTVDLGGVPHTLTEGVNPIIFEIYAPPGSHAIPPTSPAE